MAHLTRDQILRAEDIKTEEVAVPERNGEVLVRGLTGRERDEFEATLVERRGKKTAMNTANIRAKLVSLCVVDDNGAHMFTHSDVEDLGKKSAAAVSRIYDVAARLSGISDEDVEELVGDFGETPGKSSSSPSQRPMESPSASS